MGQDAGLAGNSYISVQTMLRPYHERNSYIPVLIENKILVFVKYLTLQGNAYSLGFTVLPAVESLPWVVIVVLML